MPGRIWFLVGAILAARITSGIQFQAAAAAGPALVEGLALAYVALGTLIGAYSASGVVVSFPCSWLQARLGDRRMLLAALGLQTAGAAVMAVAPGFGTLLAGRVIAGCGHVLLTVVLPTTIIESTPKPQLGLVMGLFLASYGVGIGIAIVGLPLVASWRLAFGIAGVLSAGAGLAMAAAMPARPARGTRPGGGDFRLRPASWAPLLLMAGVWTLENAAYAILLGFTMPFFLARGMALPRAAGLASLFAFVGLPLMPFGAWILGRSLGVRSGVLLALGVTVVAPVLVAWGWPAIPLLIAGSVALCVVAAPQFTSVGAALQPGERALAMGVFWTIYYIGMSALPPLAGLARDISGDPGAPLYVASGFLAMAMALQAARG